MNLSSQQRKKITDALLDAFPDKSSLEQMLLFELDKSLDTIVGGSNLQNIVFNLIKTSKSENWIADLINAARNSNPGNPKLKAIAEELLTNHQEEPLSGASPNSPTEQITQQLKILILNAIPGKLRLDKETREIEYAIRTATRRDLFDIRTRTAIRHQDIRRAIAEEQPQIVHFCGHGNEDGSLMLEDSGGNNKPVSPLALTSLFKLHANYVKCLLLNACYSEKAAIKISQYINYVIGMNNPIQDKAAIEFAKGFYEGLGYKTLSNQDLYQRAFDEGMVAIQMENLSQGVIPVLKKNSNLLNLKAPVSFNIKTDNLPEQPRETLPPFDSKFTDWEKSNSKDRIQLLCGQELQEAINWSENNKLNNHKHDFLIESIVWDRQRIKKEIFSQCWVGNETLIKPLYEKEMNVWLTSNCQDKSQLLCGKKLKKVIFWADKNNLIEQELNFIINSLVWNMYEYTTVSAEEEKEKTEVSKFIKEIWSKLQTKTKHPYKVVQEVLSWTECQPFLTKKICQLICNSNSSIPEGGEKVRIEQIVQAHLNKDSQDQDIVQHFQVIYDRLLKNENHDTFWLLLEYRKILQHKEVTDNQILEVLLNIRLVVNQQEKLRVHNCIYQSIFNQDWIEIMILEDARPYAQKLLAWLDSDCQDKSQLLNEQELQEAVQWTKGKGDRLKTQDKKFIARSQALKFSK